MRVYLNEKKKDDLEEGQRWITLHGRKILVDANGDPVDKKSKDKLETVKKGSSTVDKKEEINKKIRLKKYDIEEIEEKLKKTESKFNKDSSKIKDELEKSKDIKVKNDLYVAKTGSIYFTIIVDDEEYKVRIADHHQTSYDHHDPDLKIFSDGNTSNWYNRFTDFFDKHNLKPTQDMKKCEEHLEKKEELVKLNKELQKLNDEKSNLMQTEQPQDERLEKIMDYVEKNKNLLKEWEELKKIGGSTGKNERRLFRRRVESQMEEKQNAKQMPKVYYCKHIEKGLVKYQDGMVYIGDEALKKMSSTFVGKPVFVKEHKKVDLDNLQQEADGYVVDCFYNELDGWFWAKFIAISDDAHEAISRGWSVSNAYIPTEYGDGGVRNNVKYDNIVLNGEYTHLAIVSNPRYEKACIFNPEEYKLYMEKLKQDRLELTNSQDKGKGTFMKFWKKSEVKDAVELENAIVELDDGSEVKLSDAIKALESAKEAEKEEDKKDVDMDTIVNVGDEKITIKELMNRYSKLRKNQYDEKKEEDEEEKTKSNEKAEEDEKKKAEAKENSKHFDELKNSIQKGSLEDIKNKCSYETSDEKIKRGKERY